MGDDFRFCLIKAAKKLSSGAYLEWFQKNTGLGSRAEQTPNYFDYNSRLKALYLEL